MLFNSFAFLYLFLPCALLGYYTLGRLNATAAAFFMGMASLFFYGYWSPSALPILLASIFFNYWIGMGLAKQAKLQSDPAGSESWPLKWAVGVNLVYLGFFKYADFFIQSGNWGLNQLSLPEIQTLNIVLPIGISFFTFTQIAFLVDCKRGKVAERNFIHYLLFVTFFPHLIAGPVLHHAQMMPQFAAKNAYRFSAPTFIWGVCIFAIGFGKKMLIADPISLYADALFEQVGQGLLPSFASSWFGVLAYYAQIYFDFSGYSDMAVGLGLLFNIRLPINFNHPYKALNIIDFWRRWHISLSTFLRDYLYIALGGNRHGSVRRYMNLLATMLLGGLWHGANWTFFIWGGLHGLALIANHGWRFLRKSSSPDTRLHQLLSWCVTFIFVCFTWVVFRSDNMDTALAIYRGMLGLNDFALNMVVPGWKRELNFTLSIGLFAWLVYQLGRQKVAYTGTLDNKHAPSFQHIGWPLALFTIALLLLGIEQIGQRSVFLYFQF